MSEGPQRVQLSRKKGAKLPPGTVVVARPSRWGNPFKVGKITRVWHEPGGGGELYLDHFEVIGARHAVRLYASALERDPRWFHESWKAPSKEELEALRGKNLACWCKPGEPCHADVLLEVANAL